MNKPVSFFLAKLLKGKEFDKTEGVYKFYVNPRSKMFGIDDEGRCYPIKNTSKKLYTIGEHATLNSDSVYLAPTISDVVMWIYDKHRIWINVHQENRINGLKITSTGRFQSMINRVNHTTVFGKKSEGDIEEGMYRKPVNTPTEAYEAAIEYTLTNLIN